VAFGENAETLEEVGVNQTFAIKFY
jgi:hypothetical protein